MSRAVRIHQPGDPSVLSLEKVDLPALQADDVLLHHTTVGLNFDDILHRRGQRPIDMPSILGLEGCGYIEDIGPDVLGLDIGDRVAYATAPVGAYCDQRVIDRFRVVPVPGEISDDVAAAVLRKGLTAHYLLFRAYSVMKDIPIVVHAAAGGVGYLMCQWAKHIGAKVIGTVGSAGKVPIAQSAGCDVVINRQEHPSFSDIVKEHTDGFGACVVYDSIGQSTFDESLASLRNFGTLMSFGEASGPIPSVDPARLREQSLFVAFPMLEAYKAFHMELVLSANEVFEKTMEGVLTPRIHKTYALEDIATAHQELETGKTVGQCIISL